MQKENLTAPAFPPQLMQDSLGRVGSVVGFSGMTKLEFVASMLLPIYTQLQIDLNGISIKGERVTPAQASYIMAKEFFETLNKNQDETDSTIVM